MKLTCKNKRRTKMALDKGIQLCYDNGWFRSREERNNVIEKNFLRNFKLQEEYQLRQK